MEKPTDILVEEHILIMQAMEIFQKAVEKMQREENPPREFFDKVVAFASIFVDAFHHYKEEHLMFARLALQKEGEIDSGVGLLRFQHERGRWHINEIGGALGGYSREEPKSATIILENLAAYIALLKLHIYQEDNIFFPLVEVEISEDDQKYLSNLFKIEEVKVGKGSFEKARAMIKDMEDLL